MMLDTLGESAAAKAVEDAVMWTTANKVRNLAAGQMGYTTTEVGDLVATRVAG
jgi:3-isopropylmalate dehydrogenase